MLPEFLPVLPVREPAVKTTPGVLRGHNPVRAFYEQLVGRGKPMKVALVAAACTHDPGLGLGGVSFWSPLRCHQNPAPGGLTLALHERICTDWSVVR